MAGGRGPPYSGFGGWDDICAGTQMRSQVNGALATTIGQASQLAPARAV